MTRVDGGEISLLKDWVLYGCNRYTILAEPKIKVINEGHTLKRG